MGVHPSKIQPRIEEPEVDPYTFPIAREGEQQFAMIKREMLMM